MQNRLEGWEKEIRRSRNFEYSSYQAHLLPRGSMWHWGGRTGLELRTGLESMTKIGKFHQRVFFHEVGGIASYITSTARLPTLGADGYWIPMSGSLDQGVN